MFNLQESGGLALRDLICLAPSATEEPAALIQVRARYEGPCFLSIIPSQIKL